MKVKFSIKIERKLSTTPRGFTYLLLTYQGIGGMRKCDRCHKPMRHAHVVYALQECLCTECFNDWVAHSKTYSQFVVDIELRKQQRFQDEWYEYQIYRMVLHDKGFYS